MGCKPRPVPADFVEVMRDKPAIVDLCKLYRTGDSVVRRWMREIGYSIDRLRPMPSDFADIAASMAKFELKKHYAASQKTLDRWLKDCGAVTKGTIKPAPADFAEVAATMCAVDLRQHYSAGAERIKRWIKETGAEPLPYVPMRKPRLVVTRPKATGTPRSPYVATQMRARNYSQFDQAADILRRANWIVYHATETGKPDPKGAFWRVGNVVCTDDELLARATRYERKAA